MAEFGHGRSKLSGVFQRAVSDAQDSENSSSANIEENIPEEYGGSVTSVKVTYNFAPQDRRRIGEESICRFVINFYKDKFRQYLFGEKVNGMRSVSFEIMAHEPEKVKKVASELAKILQLSEYSRVDIEVVAVGDYLSEPSPFFSSGKKMPPSGYSDDTVNMLGSKYGKLSEELLKVVKGQDAAVRKFVEGCFQGSVFEEEDAGNHPKAYFFFFGPPGTGKTLLAETAAKSLDIYCDRYDMSDYATEVSVDELIGTSQIYTNAREGRLVDFVAKNPECLLIFDEIEKAHINVMRLFLQILGSGHLRSKYSEKFVDFRKTMIIFTSNVGRELYEDRSVNLTTLPQRVLIDAVRAEKNSKGEQALPDEMCSRIAAGNTILFNHLNVRCLTELAVSGFDRVVSSMEKKYACEVMYESRLPLLFLFNRGNEIDARIASGQSGNFLKREIYELSRQLEKREDAPVVSGISFEVDMSSASAELKPLFENDGKSKVLVFADDNINELFENSNVPCEVMHAKDIPSARELLKHDFTAIFIDPFFGSKGDGENALSVSDYNTAGVSFFHELCETGGRLPIYLLDVDPPFSEVDRRTFLQEGAVGVISFGPEDREGFGEKFRAIMDELYMEKQNISFAGRGFVVDFKTRQTVGDDGYATITFYDLKKRLAVDMDSRGTILGEADRPDVKFDDVIGAENAKKELSYFIRFLKNPREFILSGNKAPGGVLLYGPPGTGKTMLAKAMAGECDVSFIQAAASDFANKYVGESEENIRRLFRRARKYAPSIIFIDEIDAIGKQRTGADPNTEKMLNTLLTQMQGFSNADPDRPVFVLAATNYGAGGEGSDKGIAALDEALVRRFDNKIYVDLPNEEERKKYLSIQLAKKNINVPSDIISNIAERTPGFSLAILSNIIDIAFREAERNGKRVDGDALLKALEDYQHGERKEHGEEYYKRVAIHEIGHAYVSHICGEDPSYITIESRGDFGGYMQRAGSEDRVSFTREELIGRIRTSLAGRAAEYVFYGDEIANNTGASSDLKNATDIAFAIFTTYGMEEGDLAVLSREEALSSAVAGDYLKRVNELLSSEMEKTKAIIEEGKDDVLKLAGELVKRNHLTGAEFLEILGK